MSLISSRNASRLSLNIQGVTKRDLYQLKETYIREYRYKYMSLISSRNASRLSLNIQGVLIRDIDTRLLFS